MSEDFFQETIGLATWGERNTVMYIYLCSTSDMLKLDVKLLKLRYFLYVNFYVQIPGWFTS